MAKVFILTYVVIFGLNAWSCRVMLRHVISCHIKIVIPNDTSISFTAIDLIHLDIVSINLTNVNTLKVNIIHVDLHKYILRE